MPLEHIQTLEGHTDRVWTLAWNPAGTVLATAGADKSVRLWTKQNADANWSCVAILEESHNKSIRRVCWSPCGRFIASASFDSTVCIWNRNQQDGSWSTDFNLDGHENEVKSVSWSHDGQFLASCGRDRTIMIWEKANNEDDEDDHRQQWDCSDVKTDHTKDVKHIVWHPKHNILASCSYDDTVKFFSKLGDDWKCYETLTSHTSTVWSADFSATGEYLVSCSDDKTIRVWRNHSHDKLPQVEARSWKCISVVQGFHNRTIYDVSWNNITDDIVSASGDNSLVFYSQVQDPESQDTVYKCADKHSKSHDCDINCVAWNQSQRGLLASGSDDRKIKIWRYSPAIEGMTTPLTIMEQVVSDLEKAGLKKQLALKDESTPSTVEEREIVISDFANLMKVVHSIQILQAEHQVDKEICELEQILDIKITDRNPTPVEFENLRLDETDGMVNEFTVVVTKPNSDSKINYRISFDKSQFKLCIPRRSLRLVTLAGELFLFEKTGDLLKVLPSGQTKFVLGHLFMFTDVRFVTSKNSNKIALIISADRDEKIRISHYPDAFNIVSFAFGHKHFVRRLILIDGDRFISIDQQNKVCVWTLEKMMGLKPDKVLQLCDGEAIAPATKRLCTGRRGTREESAA